MIHFSIIVCTYERPEALANCLKSISNMDYNYSGFEVIVIDDGSVADYTALLNKYSNSLNLNYLKVPHRGVAAARNKGIDHAQGEYLAFVDDDCTLREDYLGVAERFFNNNPSAQVLTFSFESCGKSSFRHVQTLYYELVLRSTPGELLEGGYLIRSPALPASRAAVIRRTAFSTVGKFDESLLGGEDGELTTRLRAHGIPIYYLPDHHIYHWERKGLVGFLKQRVEYATSLYEVQKIRDGLVPNTDWTFLNSIWLAIKRYYGWIGLSWRIGRFGQFVLLSPFLLLFLLIFYLTLFWRKLTDR